MATEPRDINFGAVDHFLYVRLNCVCADLGYSNKQLVEQAYFLVVDLIKENGETMFIYLRDQYAKYADFRERNRYSPRMSEQKHQVVVNGIHEEVHAHLVVMKDENQFTWATLLSLLLMAVELEIDKGDESAWLKAVTTEAIAEDLSDYRMDGDVNGYSIDKTRKRREYEDHASVYPEKSGFRKTE